MCNIYKEVYTVYSQNNKFFSEFSYWMCDSIAIFEHYSVHDVEVFMHCIVDNMPNVLWIWDIPKLRLATVLIQLSPIRSEWNTWWSLLNCTVYMKTHWFSDKANFTSNIWLHHVSSISHTSVCIFTFGRNLCTLSKIKFPHSFVRKLLNYVLCTFIYIIGYWDSFWLKCVFILYDTGNCGMLQLWHGIQHSQD